VSVSQIPFRAILGLEIGFIPRGLDLMRDTGPIPFAGLRIRRARYAL
jgi:hypothetical protein